MRNRDLRSKIFNIVAICLIFISFTVSLEAVKILRPGDIVKGKEITETYYCLSEKENLEILNKINSVDLLKLLVDKKEEKIESLKDTIELLRLRLEAKNDQKELTKELYNKSLVREKALEKEVKIQEDEKNRERRRRKRSFLGGALTGAGIVGKILGLF